MIPSRAIGIGTALLGGALSAGQPAVEADDTNQPSPRVEPAEGHDQAGPLFILPDFGESIAPTLGPPNFHQFEPVQVKPRGNSVPPPPVDEPAKLGESAVFGDIVSLEQNLRNLFIHEIDKALDQIISNNGIEGASPDSSIEAKLRAIGNFAGVTDVKVPDHNGDIVGQVRAAVGIGLRSILQEAKTKANEANASEFAKLPPLQRFREEAKALGALVGIDIDEKIAEGKSDHQILLEIAQTVEDIAAARYDRTHYQISLDQTSPLDPYGPLISLVDQIGDSLGDNPNKVSIPGSPDSLAELRINDNPSTPYVDTDVKNDETVALALSESLADSRAKLEKLFSAPVNVEPINK